MQSECESRFEMSYSEGWKMLSGSCWRLFRNSDVFPSLANQLSPLRNSSAGSLKHCGSASLKHPEHHTLNQKNCLETKIIYVRPTSFVTLFPFFQIFVISLSWWIVILNECISSHLNIIILQDTAEPVFYLFSKQMQCITNITNSQ